MTFKIGDIVVYESYKNWNYPELCEVVEILRKKYKLQIRLKNLNDNHTYKDFDDIDDFRLATTEEVANLIAKKMLK